MENNQLQKVAYPTKGKYMYMRFSYELWPNFPQKDLQRG